MTPLYIPQRLGSLKLSAESFVTKNDPSVSSETPTLPFAAACAVGERIAPRH